jgi:hypothetical protein
VFAPHVVGRIQAESGRANASPSSAVAFPAYRWRARRKQRASKSLLSFGAANDIGGAWRENFSGFGLQSPKQLFEIPGFPWTAEKWGSIPTALPDRGPVLPTCPPRPRRQNSGAPTNHQTQNPNQKTTGVSALLVRQSKLEMTAQPLLYEVPHSAERWIAVRLVVVLDRPSKARYSTF